MSDILIFIALEAAFHIGMEIIIDRNKTLRALCREYTINDSRNNLHQSIKEAVQRGYNRLQYQ